WISRAGWQFGLRVLGFHLAAVVLSKYTLHSTITVRVLGQYTRYPFNSSDIPTKHPSRALAASLESGCSWRTHTREPQACRPHRSGFLPVSASYSVIPSSAFVDVRFLSQTAWRTASPHKNLGSLLECSIAWTFSSRVRFKHSAMPFCAGVSCTVSLNSVPAL
ncbi:hypothetical protein NEOLEDRAFT_1195114, partial [Neolentinus lepideus HHB14362 ss-1]